MDMISTKELAERWQVSTSRIVRLAKSGRIPGARLVGKSWVFPPDTEKPSDKRRKENKSEPAETDFRFPLYLYHNYTTEEISNCFTDEEQVLYKAEVLYHEGNYQDCADILNSLAETTVNRYVRYGVLFYLCTANIMLCNFDHAFKYYNELSVLQSEETLHRNEMEYLIRDLEVYFAGNQYYLDDFLIDVETKFPYEMKDYLILECAYSDLLKAYWKGVPVNPELYELNGIFNRNSFSPLSAVTMHVYLSLICYVCQKTEKSILYAHEAAKIAEENNLEHAADFLIRYLPDEVTDDLRASNPAQLARLTKISSEFTEVFHCLLEYIGKNRMLQALEIKDVKYISFAVKGMTNKEVASTLHLSENTVSKKYSVLFEKTGTHSKKELVHFYNEAVTNY